MFNYNDALNYLDSFADYEKTGMDRLRDGAGLERLMEVLERIGNPERSYRSVHVAGTKGKGSVAAFTASILKESGFHVGLYTSPHLETIRERIMFDGEMISEKDFAYVATHVKELEISVPLIKGLTYFEVLTLLAMLYFKERKAAYAVFECGLGGRFDATNALDADVSAITPISYDHVEILGNKLSLIAAEKSAIIKRNGRCVSSPQEEEALKVIRERCDGMDASLSLVGKDITYRVVSMGPEGSHFDIIGKLGKYEDCHTVMPGDFQIENATAAVGVVESLVDRQQTTDNEQRKTNNEKRDLAASVKIGIEKAFLPGRLEVISTRPLFVIDGAHNAASAGRLKDSVEQIFKYDKLILLLGLSRDKDIEGVCRELAPLADEVILTRASVTRAMDPFVIKGYMRGKNAVVANNVKEALGLAFGLSGKNDMILATGSFYLIGEIRSLLRNSVKREASSVK